MKAAPAHISLESHHLPELDGVRGLAILAVLLAHGANFLQVIPSPDAAHPMSLFIDRVLLQGWGGVDLFFALSGFLITGILLRSRTRETYFSSFYMRRVLRIFPVYYVFLIATLSAAYLFTFPALDLPHAPRWWLPYFFYLQNWPMFWTSWVGMTSLWGTFWSLAVEEQFYVVWPAMIRFISPRVMLVLCLCGFLLGTPERMWMMHLHGVQFGIMQWPFSRLDGLFLGAAIALYRDIHGHPVPLRLAVTSSTVGAALWLWLVLVHPDELMLNGRHIWSLGVVGTALLSAGLIAATQHRSQLLHQLLTIAPLRVAGRLSYGMYIYHLLVFRLELSFLRRVVYPRLGHGPNALEAVLVMLGAILAVALVAQLSFCYLESPFLGLKRLFPSPPAPVSPVAD